MKILVGFDNSNVAKDALKLAQEHAKAFHAEIHVLRSVAQSRELKFEDIEKAEKELEKNVQTYFEGSGLSFESHLIVSSLSSGEDLVRFAERKKVEEIFIGVRRRSKVGKLVFGSTAQFVILEAPCPVVSVK
jgi:nucleotide-binding universal stress UspA family protein